MSLAYVAAKLFVNMFICIYFGGHLGFRLLDLFSAYKKMQSLFFLEVHDILSQNQVKNQF